MALAAVRDHFAAPLSIGLDYAAEPMPSWRVDRGSRFLRGSANELPFAGGRFDLVFTLDVMGQVEVDEARALGELARILKPGGRAIVVVPAYQWLHSAHDRAVHSARRHTTDRLRSSLARAGFRVVETRYLFASTFPLVAGFRMLRKWLGGEEGAESSDVAVPSAPVNFVLETVVRIERALTHRIPAPFGTSVMAVGERP
jgi:SAM-dependent methyltransferase